MTTAALTSFVKQEARRLGFDHCGISKATFLEDQAAPLELWLKQKRHGEMAYMENHFEKRLDPRLMVDGAKTVISLLFNYFTEAQKPSMISESDKSQQRDELPKISRYAYGHDYHKVLKDKLYELLNSLRTHGGQIQGRCFVDSAPILERAWAKKSGLGWVGKNTMLIHPKSGSFYFLAELVIDLELNPDQGGMQDYCGTCNKCVEACPTGALIGNKTIDATKCISYFTIELKNEFQENTPAFNDWMFGCDVCQEVCPWNRFAMTHNEPQFKPLDNLLGNSYKDWLEMTEETFGKLYKNSPIQRPGLNNLKRNVQHLLKQH